jgi:hypothetical protein
MLWPTFNDGVPGRNAAGRRFSVGVKFAFARFHCGDHFFIL